MENKKKNSFSPSSSSSFSSFETLSINDTATVAGSTSFFPKYSPTLSFYRKKMVGPRSPRCFLSDEVDGGRYFLDTCHLCKRPIGDGRDIFMYRGNMPFCSEECREEQIEMDEAKEMRAKVSKNQAQKKNSTSPSKIHVWFTGTVVAG